VLTEEQVNYRGAQMSTVLANINVGDMGKLNRNEAAQHNRKIINQ
jgi:hypothetical protein